MGPWKGSTSRFRTLRLLMKSQREVIKFFLKTLTSNTWPRFLVIGSTNDEALKKLSPFAIQKGLDCLAGEPKSVKKLRNGSLLIECPTQRHSKNLFKSKTLYNIPINVTPHTTLNFSKGVVRSKDLEGVSEEEICENLSSQGVSSVKRINELVPTNTLILTFNTPTLPDSVKAGYLRIPVVSYIPNPLRCFKCQKFGHGQNTCRGRLTCARCGQFDHESKACQNEMACRLPIVTENTSRTRESARGGKWKKQCNK